MNWYKKIKISQYYTDIAKEDYEDNINFQANQYFSIGQNEETQDKSYCWIFINNRLFVKKGHGTHNLNFGNLFDNIDRIFRGWYDPVQNLLSVVVPRQRGNNSIYGEVDIPNRLDKALRRKFGNNFEYKVF